MGHFKEHLSLVFLMNFLLCIGKVFDTSLFAFDLLVRSSTGKCPIIQLMETLNGNFEVKPSLSIHLQKLFNSWGFIFLLQLGYHDMSLDHFTHLCVFFSILSEKSIKRIDQFRFGDRVWKPIQWRRGRTQLAFFQHVDIPIPWNNRWAFIFEVLKHWSFLLHLILSGVC